MEPDDVYLMLKAITKHEAETEWQEQVQVVARAMMTTFDNKRALTDEAVSIIEAALSGKARK